jgi:hypothetical protein
VFAIVYVSITVCLTIGLAVLWLLYANQEPDSRIKLLSGFAAVASLMWSIYPVFLLCDYRGVEGERERTMFSLAPLILYCFVLSFAYVIDPIMPSLDRPLVCVVFGLAMVAALSFIVLLSVFLLLFLQHRNSHREQSRIVSEFRAHYGSTPSVSTNQQSSLLTQVSP